MDKLYNQLIQIISDSAAQISGEYFNFPVAGLEETIKRERIYCGELYHQLRNRIGAIPYTVNIEPNKKQHPYIEDHCGAVDPDLIIHRPGMMTPKDNLAIVEVKKSSGNLTHGINKDLQTINCMTTLPNGYYGGIILVFGKLTDLKQTNLIERISAGKNAENQRLTVMLHKQVNFIPEIIEIE